MAFSVHRAIYAILTGAAEVTALVGTHIYPRVIPESVTAKEVIRYAVIDNDPVDTKDGYADLDVYLVQFDFYSASGDTAQEMYLAARSALLSTTTNTEYAGVMLDGIRLDNDQEGYEEDVKLHRVIADFEIRVKR